MKLHSEPTGCPLPARWLDCFLPPMSVDFLELSRLMSESRAVVMACEAIEGRENPLRVKQFIQGLLGDRPPTTEDQVAWYAMTRIAGGATPPAKLEGEGLFEATAWAWMTWVTSGPDQGAIQVLDRATQEAEGPSVLHHLALSNWAKAVRALHLGEMTEAKRLFRRAVDVGGQFGTESNPTVVWSYAATFFPVT